MKRTSLTETGKKTALVAGLSAFLLLALTGFGGHAPGVAAGVDSTGKDIAAPPPPPPPRHWTAVASTGTFSDASLSLYAFDGPGIRFKSAAGTAIVARYNVTNTFDNNALPSVPGWTTFELASHAPPNTTVQAKLLMVKPCDRVEEIVCLLNNAGQGGPKCDTCTFDPGKINFAAGLYYVEITLGRTASNVTPLAFSLRLY